MKNAISCLLVLLFWVLPATAHARSRELITVSAASSTLRVDRSWVEVNCTNSGGCTMTLATNLPSVEDAKVLCLAHACTLVYKTSAGTVSTAVAVGSVAEVSYDGEGNWYLSAAVAANPTVTATPTATATATAVPTSTPTRTPTP